MTNVAVIIPFRDRGLDYRRAANLEIVMQWWYVHGFDPKIVSDGGSGDSQFNRHKAYNRAVSGNLDADVFVFAEADMLIHPEQIHHAVFLASVRMGLVVPFTQYRYLADSTTDFIRETCAGMTDRDLIDWWTLDANHHNSIFDMRAESTMDNGKSIGAVNVVSRRTLEVTGGFTEMTEGNWYDDNIIEESFTYLTKSPTRFVSGPAVHLYHLPGHSGDHLTDADKKSTARNRDLLVRIRADIKMKRSGPVRRIMQYREGV